LIFPSSFNFLSKKKVPVGMMDARNAVANHLNEWRLFLFMRKRNATNKHRNPTTNFTAGLVTKNI
jgi:hypothetical protein